MALRKPQGSRASAFPTLEESLALQASLLDGDRAIEAWRRLSATGNPMKGGVGWIAPLLVMNLARIIPSDPWVRSNPHFLTLSHLKGRAVTESAQSTLHCLAEAGVPTLALKGLALGAAAYASPGLRTVSDLDILVPRTAVFEAASALRARGLRAGRGEPQTTADLRVSHAHVFYPHKAHQPSIDLHWHVLSSARGDDDDSAFWSGSLPLEVGTAMTRSLCPEDQLLHVLVHGVRWTRMPHVRWVADAVMVLRKASTGFRVDRFLAHVEKFDAVAPVQEGLRFVFNLVGEGGDLLDPVERLKASRFAQKAFEARATAYEDRTLTERIALRLESARWARRALGSKRSPLPGPFTASRLRAASKNEVDPGLGPESPREHSRVHAKFTPPRPPGGRGRGTAFWERSRLKLLKTLTTKIGTRTISTPPWRPVPPERAKPPTSPSVVCRGRPASP